MRVNSPYINENILGSDAWKYLNSKSGKRMVYSAALEMKDRKKILVFLEFYDSILSRRRSWREKGLRRRLGGARQCTNFIKVLNELFDINDMPVRILRVGDSVLLCDKGVLDVSLVVEKDGIYVNPFIQEKAVTELQGEFWQKKLDNIFPIVYGPVSGSIDNRDILKVLSMPENVGCLVGPEFFALTYKISTDGINLRGCVNAFNRNVKKSDVRLVELGGKLGFCQNNYYY